ncbi:MAG: DUF6797 domain-containing protein [Pirellulales bacterium]
MPSSPVFPLPYTRDIIRGISRGFSLSLLFICSLPILSAQDNLEQRLLARKPDQLAEVARLKGDPRRGAIVFHSPSLNCQKCHTLQSQSSPSIGPNLAAYSKNPSDTELIQAVLRPSETIADAYRTVQVVDDEGQVWTGVPVERDSNRLKLRLGAEPDRVVEIERASIVKETQSKLSIMPAGQVLQLTDQSQFYDLIAYLIAIRDGGESAVARYAPKANQIQLVLPEYEKRVDHAGMLRDWNAESLARGEEIYRMHCVNCHGTLEEPGSLPTALRFGEGKFKKGSDPHSMYQTLTRGNGMMLPQPWMVPQQKYDVIHYIREHFLRKSNPSQFVAIDATYLDRLPKGDTRGPAPKKIEPWVTMDYGSMMITTLELGKSKPKELANNIAQKAIALRLDEGPGGIARGQSFMAFEHDTLRWAGGWSGEGYIDWDGIQFNGRHGVHPHIVGDILFQNPTGPGWANPETGSFEDDSRVQGRDGRRYGPLPKRWGRYLGLERKGGEVLLSYQVGDTRIEEQAWTDASSESTTAMMGRSLRIDPHPTPLRMLIATFTGSSPALDQEKQVVQFTSSDAKNFTFYFGANPLPKGGHYVLEGERLILEFPPSTTSYVGSLYFGRLSSDQASSHREAITAVHRQGMERSNAATKEFQNWKQKPYTPLWDEVLVTTPGEWYRDNAWTVDEIRLPATNPWNARTRVTGMAFHPRTDTLFVCTWDGDVWRAQGLDSLERFERQVSWKRIASGLFQPLGILLEGDDIVLSCRDQIVKLHDVDGDGTMDVYRCFNSDHQVTEHFHEFAMGLQKDPKGNYYYAKSARHALPAVVPHHGTLLRVTPDGQETQIVAFGFRAANGVCLNPDGSFIVTDQEGHWNPKNRINWVREGGFYGNMFGYHDVTDSRDEAMEQPLCWITNAFDRSPAELLWADHPKWGPLYGQLLNLSYGYGRVYTVPMEMIDGQPQGGMCPLPIPDLPTGIIRGTFSPRDGQLYVGGMYAWASSRQDQEGGLFRIAYRGGPPTMPVGLQARQQTLDIRWSDPLSPEMANAIDRFKVQVWDLKRTQNYGSEHYNQRVLEVTGVELRDENRTVRLTIPDLQPTWGMSVDMKIKNGAGEETERTLHNTIHNLPKLR